MQMQVHIGLLYFVTEMKFDSVMCGYFCIGFIDFMLAGKNMTDYTSLFSPHDFKKNDNIILSYFKNE